MPGQPDDNENLFYQSINKQLLAQSYAVIFGECSSINLSAVFDGTLNRFLAIHFDLCRRGQYKKDPIFQDLREVEEYLLNFCPPKSLGQPGYVYILAIGLPADKVRDAVNNHSIANHIKAAIDGYSFISDSIRGEVSKGTVVPNPNYQTNV
jgi:hypothetical protein